MSFAQAVARGEFPVALEITPPRSEKPAVLLRRARLLDGCTMAVNVIQRPDRQSSLDAALALKREGIEPVWHLTSAGRTAADLTPDIERGRDGGIANVLCLRGDHAIDSEAPSITVRETIALVRRLAPDMLIAAALDQYHEGEGSRRALIGKLRAGASCVWTQPVFDLPSLNKAAELVKGENEDAHIVAMAMPLLTSEGLEHISARLRVPVPESLRRRIAVGEDEAWRAFDETLEALVAAPLIDGVALMTYKADPPPGTAERIAEGLRRAGLLAVEDAV